MLAKMWIVRFNIFKKHIYINKSFYLSACKPDEIYDIILSFDIKKS